MTDMIERVARTMQDDYRKVMGGAPNIQTFRKWAISAISAMREPTEAMGDAAVKDHDNHASHMTSYHCVMEAWRNMIDAALEEKK